MVASLSELATAALSSSAAWSTQCAARSKCRPASSSATPASRRNEPSNSASASMSATSSRRATGISWATGSISPRGWKASRGPGPSVFPRMPTAKRGLNVRRGALLAHLRRLDPIDRSSRLVGPINPDGVAALAQAGERCACRVRQPAGCGDKLAESRAISALQQFDDVRYLGSAARRGSDRRGKPPSRRNPLRIPRGDGPWRPFADSFVDRRAARLRLRVASRASANGFVGKGLVDPNVVPAYTLDGKPLLESAAHGHSAEPTHVFDRGDRFVDSVDDEAGLPMLDHFGHGASAPRDDRRATPS